MFLKIKRSILFTLSRKSLLQTIWIHFFLLDYGVEFAKSYLELFVEPLEKFRRQRKQALFYLLI